MNLVKGCKIKVSEPVFIGSYPNAKYSHHKEYIGTIIKESYGKKTGQHTFTILLDDGSKILRKGRNIYPNLIEIIQKPDEETFQKLAKDKQIRKNISINLKNQKFNSLF